MIPTVPCDTCGGSGFEPIPDEPEFDVDVDCPDCVAGRVPSREALDAAAAVIVKVNCGPTDDRVIANLALLAVMRLAREENL